MVSELLSIFAVMYSASMTFLWLRAVWSVGRPDFDWGVFCRENFNRLLLQFGGCVVSAVNWMLDPIGVKAFAEAFGPIGFVASVGGIGLLVGYLSLWKEVSR